ncbi:MAG: lytic transglycosylase domain-containing protein [Pseudomonadales bacterium]|nr:lytic transglycosylase domain-containing protein [Pseudomonadales bacterium]
MRNCLLFLLSALLCVPAIAGRDSLPQHGNRQAQINDAELKQFLQQGLQQERVPFDKYDAEVWLESMLSRMARYKVERSEALAILHAVYREARASELEPDLVLAVIAIESAFKRFAVSRVGAQGLMQVMPFWKAEIGRAHDNLMDIETNIRYGCKILQFYLQKSRGNLDEALARYNGSYGRTVYSEKVLVNWQHRWQSGRLSRH